MSRGFVIVCGGTGGHLAPGIAIAQRMEKKAYPVTLVVSRKEIDKQLSRQYENLNFIQCPGEPFSLRPLAFLNFVRGVIQSFLFSYRFLKKEEPMALMAFGGFLSVGFAIAARICDIPLFLHEANRVSGRSIRYLSRFAKRVYLPEGVLVSGVKFDFRRQIGMPLRLEVKHIPKEKIRHQMKIPRYSKVLVVVGGSQGAQALNDWLKQNFQSLMHQGLWIYCVTGPGKDEELTDHDLEDDNGEQVGMRIFSFHERLYELFSCADLVVSRAGAGTIAELIECRCPSILIPYPYAADNHQEANALDLEKRGGCLVLPQREIERLNREVLDMIFNDWLLDKMRYNLTQMNHGDAAEQLIEDMERSLYGRNPIQPGSEAKSEVL